MNPGSTSRLVITVIVLIVVLSSVNRARAHNVGLVHSEPAAGSMVDQSPRQIVAKFGEEVQPKGSSLQLVNDQGKVVGGESSKLDLNDVDHATLLLPISSLLPDGNYSVRWHITLLDDDVSEGQFGFTIGKNTTAPRIANQSTDKVTSASAISNTPPPNSFMASPDVWLPMAGLIAIVLVITLFLFSKQRRRSP